MTKAIVFDHANLVLQDTNNYYSSSIVSGMIDMNLIDKNVRLRKSRHANICSKNQFFRENVVVIAFSELRPGSNERYENSTFYGPFRFLIFILIFNKKTIL